MSNNHEFKDFDSSTLWSGDSDDEDNVDHKRECLDDQIVVRTNLLARLLATGDAIRSLHARLTLWHGRDAREASDWTSVVDSFLQQASTVSKQDFEDLISQTASLHHKGMDILHPDSGPCPIPSPFVRRMPENQAHVEKERLQHQVRHAIAYQEHIRYCLEHFHSAMTALIDGCSICDWDMIDDEFPKLEQLKDEVQRAFAIWEPLS